MRCDFDFDIATVEELKAEMESAIKSAPDIVHEEMTKEQKAFKSEMIHETWSAVEKNTGNIIKGFKFGKIEKWQTEFFTHFYAENKKNRHFHLVNNGHNLVKNGKVIGFVPGRRIKEPVIERFEQEHWERSRRALERICDRIK